MICEACGNELHIGEWPFCPHGTPGGNAIETNERFIGGVTIENMGHDPVTVYSRAEFKAQMLKHGVEQHIKYVPGDKYLQNWTNWIDPYTMESARILVSRGH